MIRFPEWTARLWLASLIVLLGAGCDSPSHVKGTVTFDGKPLPAGQVMFLCDGKGRPAIAGKILDGGLYEIANPPAGRARVSVQTFRPPPRPAPGVDAVSGADNLADWVEPGLYVPIPQHYSAPETSGIEYTIVAGDQTFDIDLTAKKPTK